MQEKLNKLYLSYLERILADKQLFQAIEDFRISSPLFLNIGTKRGNYKKSDFKLLYVGQQTNSWFNKNERNNHGFSKISDNEKYLQALLKIYEAFNIGEDYNSALFTFLGLILEELHATHKNLGFLWTNILRHDEGGKKVSYENTLKITFDNNYIFRKELEILKPDALIFVTGPSYDPTLRETFPDITFSQYDSYDINAFAVLKSEKLPLKALRVNHPNSHKFQGGDYRYELCESIREFLLP